MDADTASIPGTFQPECNEWQVATATPSERRVAKVLRRRTVKPRKLPPQDIGEPTSLGSGSLCNEIEKLKKKVRQALQSPKFTWRTIDGISAELDLDPSVTKMLLLSMDDVVECYVKSSDGKDLFTTKQRWEAFASKRSKVLSFFIGKYV